MDETPADKAQSNFTDPELHIMQTNNKGWDYCGNAQASVDGASQIILACEVSDASNDKQQAKPVAQATLVNLAQAGIEPPKDESGAPLSIPATLDNGYYSEAAVEALESLGLIRTSLPGASGTMFLRRKPLRRPPRQKSAWPQKCGRLKARRCTADAR